MCGVGEHPRQVLPCEGQAGWGCSSLRGCRPAWPVLCNACGEAVHAAKAPHILGFMVPGKIPCRTGVLMHHQLPCFQVVRCSSTHSLLNQNTPT